MLHFLPNPGQPGPPVESPGAPPRLRPFQIRALSSLSDPKLNHLICVAPTGSGKSLIFETYIKQTGRKTLVISPLVALARQHQERLNRAGLVSELGGGHPDLDPKTQVWVLSPESLLHESTHRKIQNWKPEFLVVDECHCLWEWGASFRPAFLEIPKLLDQHPTLKKTLWLTATLTPENRIELRHTLEKTGTTLELGHSQLPEKLSLHLKKIPIAERVDAWTEEVLQTHEPGIVFAGTRKNTERISRYAKELGIRSTHYHAGLSREERQIIENDIKSQKVQLIVATSAFGMGMDFKHLTRAWIWQPPWSLLELSQAIGRVGRSEHQGRATVYWDPWDFRLLLRHPETPAYVLERLNPVREFLEENRCRRLTFSTLFGSTAAPQTCIQLAAELCDFCLRSAIR